MTCCSLILYLMASEFYSGQLIFISNLALEQSTEEAEESAYMRTCEKKLIDQLDPLVYYGISPCEQSSGN